MTHAAAVHNLHETGAELEVPRPRRPRAAGEERAEFQGEARKSVLRLAGDGFIPAFGDEPPRQACGSTRRTAGLRGIEATVPSAVERARLGTFGAVGDGFCCLVEAPGADGSELIRFHLLHELFGKVRLVLDHATCHSSKAAKKFAAKRRGWLGPHFAPVYAPGDNAAEAQQASARSALASKPLRSRAHMGEALGEAVRAGGVAPVAAHRCARAAASGAGGDAAKGPAAGVSGGHGHFCHADPPPPACGRARIPTAEGLGRDGEEVPAAEKRAALPRQLAESGLPDKFLAVPPRVLPAK